LRRELQARPGTYHIVHFDGHGGFGLIGVGGADQFKGPQDRTGWCRCSTSITRCRSRSSRQRAVRPAPAPASELPEEVRLAASHSPHGVIGRDSAVLGLERASRRAPACCCTASAALGLRAVHTAGR